ncbi:hypothetical protein Psfp_00510 [Pelotomaculum sp. FP]|nr:hypothetical protein Psfp_00510 [Pelotomaculum sp. FP]
MIAMVNPEIQSTINAPLFTRNNKYYFYIISFTPTVSML